MTYETAAAFRQAFEHRRLASLVVAAPERLVLKGALALDVDLGDDFTVSLCGLLGSPRREAGPAERTGSPRLRRTGAG